MLKVRDVMRVLHALGFFVARQRGSHVCFKHSDEHFTLVPVHSGSDIGRGLLRQILRDIQLTPEEFKNLL